MSPNILLSVQKNLKMNSMINEKRIDRLIKNMKYWKKGTIIYPNNIKSILNIDFIEVYTVLNFIEKIGLLKKCYQIYCSECKEFIDKPFLQSLNQFPEEVYCESNHKLNAFKDTILLYKVIKDE